MSKESHDSIILNIVHLVCFFIIFILIVFRILFDEIKEDIWIINYIGMSIALLSMLVEYYLYLYKNNIPKYKPFAGIIVLVIIIIFIFAILVGVAQSSEYNTLINDIVTLLAVWFSLSYSIWEILLDFITRHIR